MSLNKVLNRPLFRKEALKKGALKPIKAQTGDFIGPRVPTFGQKFTNAMSSGLGTLKTFGKDAVRTGPGGVAIYGGLEAIDPRLAAGVGAGEVGLLGASFIPGAKNTVRQIQRFTPFGMISRMPFARASGIGLAAYAGGKLFEGFKNRKREREFVKEYAKKNNLDVDEALNLYERDLPGLTRSFSGLRTSDLAKATTLASRDFKESATPLTEEQKEKIANINKAIEKRYNYQDLDALAEETKKAKQTLTEGVKVDESLTFDPDTDMALTDEANRKQIANLEETRDKAAILTGQIMNKFNINDQLKALNIASAMTEGLITEDKIQTILDNPDEYGKIPNKSNDPNHPTAVADKPESIQSAKEEPNVTLAKTLGVENEQSTPSGDKEIDLGKKFLVDLQNPRETEVNPKSYFLTKLALGLISGKTNKRGLAGAVEIAANVMGPAFDGAIALKMKNDENYRDFVTAVTERNIALYKMFNDDKKQGKYDNGSILINGVYYEAKQDRDTGNYFLVDGTGNLRPVNQNAGTFYPRTIDKNYFDQVKLLSDGYISQDILEDSIKLFKDPKIGSKVKGPAAIILSAADTLKALPEAVIEGIKGAGGDFTMTNTEDPLSDKEFKDLENRTNKVLKKLEKEFQGALDADDEAAKVLGQLEVNARFLTYSLANALKEKDRLTNRDLQLLEELTEFRLIKNPARIQEKYEELLRRVKQKNAVRRTRFGTLGNSDIAIQNIIGQIYKSTKAEARPEEKTVKPKTNEDAFDILIKKAIPN
ncbi:hypothetical protein [Hyphomonas sp.]|uniref:hypothetical protein n=1 Tax=Hyphomonas sp. TaxID=87 RepID=UPI000C8BC625|nr:hypothetical protein [Hyphomonas sp.]MAL46762.1 hypothetical protein [Hyphomonas sp.]